MPGDAVEPLLADNKSLRGGVKDIIHSYLILDFTYTHINTTFTLFDQVYFVYM